MDPLTHSFVGAAIARTRHARDVTFAAPTLIVAANLPDIDVLAFVAGADNATGFRRGWTHGPLALLVLPILQILILIAWNARRRRRRPDAEPFDLSRLSILTFVGCLSHPALDWLNTYGVRLLMPFDGRWFYGDAVFIIDPWLWLLLGGALFVGGERRGIPWGWIVLAVLATLLIFVTARIVPIEARVLWVVSLCAIVALGAVPALRKRPATIATAALVVAFMYIATLALASRSHDRWVRGELERQGIDDVTRLMVGPLPANPLRWDVLVETPAAYRHGSMRWLPRRTLELREDRIPRIRSSPIVDAALAAPQIRGVMNWMRFPYAEVESNPDGFTVYILDARYVRERSTGFGTARVELNHALEVVDAGPGRR